MSMFTKAQKIEVAPAKKKKDDKEQIPVVGLGNYAIVDAVVKGFTALQKVLGESTKADMSKIFVGIGKQTKKRPENFRGIDTDNAKVSASCELRLRSSRSPLADEEAAAFDALNIPYETVEDRQDCYLINPKYFNDSELLEKVSKALEKVKGLPEDFILHQTSVKKRIVTEDTMAAVFEKGVAESLLDMVGVLAIKPTYDGKLEEALEAAKKLAGLAEETEKEEKKSKKKAA